MSKDTLELVGILPTPARVVGPLPASASAAPVPVAAVATAGVPPVPATTVATGPKVLPKAEPAQALQELITLQQRIAKSQAAVTRLENVIADSQAELACSRKAILLLEKDYAKLHAEVGVSQDLQVPVDLSSAGDDRDLAEVVSAIRHVVATLQDYGQLQFKYGLYADGAETPMEPAAWITTELSLHLTSLAASSDRVDAGFQSKKRKIDGA